jgi:hypothetical protein
MQCPFISRHSSASACSGLSSLHVPTVSQVLSLGVICSSVVQRLALLRPLSDPGKCCLRCRLRTRMTRRSRCGVADFGRQGHDVLIIVLFEMYGKGLRRLAFKLCDESLHGFHLSVLRATCGHCLLARLPVLERQHMAEASSSRVDRCSLLVFCSESALSASDILTFTGMFLELRVIYCHLK